MVNPADLDFKCHDQSGAGIAQALKGSFLGQSTNSDASLNQHYQDGNAGDSLRSSERRDAYDYGDE